MDNSEKREVNALQIYVNKVYAIVLISITSVCLLTGIDCTTQKLLGHYKNINWITMVIFDITGFVYLSIAVFLVKTGYQNGVVRESRLKQSKIFLIILMLIQYNYLTYMVPTKELWAYSFLFAIAAGLFLDARMELITIIEIVECGAIAYTEQGDHRNGGGNSQNDGAFEKVGCGN